MASILPATAKLAPSKAQICHKGSEITVSTRALKGHMRHGDAIGSCVSVPVPTPNDLAPDGGGGVIDAGDGTQILLIPS